MDLQNYTSTCSKKIHYLGTSYYFVEVMRNSPKTDEIPISIPATGFGMGRTRSRRRLAEPVGGVVSVDGPRSRKDRPTKKRGVTIGSPQKRQRRYHSVGIPKSQFGCQPIHEKRETSCAKDRSGNRRGRHRRRRPSRTLPARRLRSAGGAGSWPAGALILMAIHHSSAGATLHRVRA